ncbi:MAG: Peptidase M24 [Thermotoga sp. 50_1627]|uniref:M24 family metallopeptidase n=1 Tax=Pseudothermotoga sp. TaxID=2033661 RepID=UPI00076C3926|nr:MAG: Peptidase M24 [Thermotoga sp. 50_64]KUK24659.1 MAG: Peptidase M24 [Thermotoga sp. 50_1627]MBC7115810.1 aminopeptidase P family protein [Pseudothermotoga sp.]MDK2923521.1 Xaa-Pro aminopeptidase [Pseudothermotoga sp.]HBT38925.1 Xaa-Pro dipeptidase [Pseudothermotoga sp.]
MERVRKFVEALEKENIDAALICNVEYSSRPTTMYLSGFTGSLSFLIITTDSQFIVTDSRYFEQAKQQSNFTLVEHRGSNIYDTVVGVLQNIKPKVIGLEFSRISHDMYLKLSEKYQAVYKPIDHIVEQMRMIKEPQEIEFIKKAIQISEEALVKVLPLVKEGVAEKDIAAELEYQMKLLGADGIAFETIVITGPRTALPHGRASERRLRMNEPVLFDFGAKFRGYCADITRTFYFGKPDEEFMKIYNTVFEAQSLALEKGSGRMTGKELDSVARTHISSGGFGEYFGHGLGHGLGLEVHEAPRVNQSNESILPVGAVVTIEPGIYIEGKFGVRIEEDVVIHEDRLERLTHLERKLQML